ncbi:RES domain-containing protein [Cytophagaceae bacterium ABcell3]|nr:RES domain-containing protein [Cytophagaceae bacterium ABcell3]
MPGLSRSAAFGRQYHDVETGLYYNRFRYYAPDEAMYVSQDPIGLAGGDRFYGYVKDCNAWVDVLGLSECKPKGKKINRTVYRFERPDRISTTWTTHPGNVSARHRYTKPGVGGVYGANSKKTALAEVNHWEAGEGKILTSKKVELNNVLDLTDAKVRNSLGINLKEITGNDYTSTQKIGDWAIKNGYDGILAPSARNATGTNLIGFTGL